ncbi:Inner membrane protein YbhI [Thelohanellus kitauei]|uniref:Inner membrane protein YbhI n=1 Tax=Thelohanellus kitauei TaxID=669202 RepID=A0A0C2J5T4_THEKT|nr:Inner membrane protein YbhI [Thelohanellus kitauei]
MDVLSGFSSGTTWLGFSAFTLSAAFVTTGLGKRLAYWFILKFGGTTLRLGYVTALLDLMLSPATPSNTARAVFPIINSIALVLGSTPKESPRQAGRYLMVNIYMVTKTTSYMFLTAFAGNALALQLISDIFHIRISWVGWALAGGTAWAIDVSRHSLYHLQNSAPAIKKNRQCKNSHCGPE